MLCLSIWPASSKLCLHRPFPPEAAASICTSMLYQSIGSLPPLGSDALPGQPCSTPPASAAVRCSAYSAAGHALRPPRRAGTGPLQFLPPRERSPSSQPEQPGFSCDCDSSSVQPCCQTAAVTYMLGSTGMILHVSTARMLIMPPGHTPRVINLKSQNLKRANRQHKPAATVRSGTHHLAAS